MDFEPTILAVLSSDADSLVVVNDHDTMTNEQMWPTHKMCGADADQLFVEASISVFYPRMEHVSIRLSEQLPN